MKIEINASPKELAELMAEIWARKTPGIIPQNPITPNPLTNDPDAWKKGTISLRREAD